MVIYDLDEHKNGPPLEVKSADGLRLPELTGSDTTVAVYHFRWLRSAIFCLLPALRSRLRSSDYYEVLALTYNPPTLCFPLLLCFHLI